MAARRARAGRARDRGHAEPAAAGVRAALAARLTDDRRGRAAGDGEAVHQAGGRPSPTSPTSCPDWRLRILGQGHQRPHLVRETRKRGLWDRVELPGSTTDMRGEWAKASICALTSRAEGFPLGAAGGDGGRRPVRQLRLRLRSARDRPARGQRPAGRARVDRRHVRGAAPARHRRRPAAAGSAPGALESAAAVGRRRARRALGGDLRGRDRAPGRPAAVRRAVGGVPRRTPPRRPASTRSGVTPGQRPGTQRSRWPSRLRQGRDRRVAGDPAARDAESPVVVLPMAARHRFLAGARRRRRLPSYLSLRDPAANGWHERRGAGRRAGPDLLRGRTSVVALEPWPSVGSGPAAARWSARAARRGGVLGGERRRAAGGAAAATATRSGSPAASTTVDHRGRGRRRPARCR